MFLSIYTLVHVVISLIGLGLGLSCSAGLLNGERLDGLTKVFLWTTVLTMSRGLGFRLIM